MSDSLQLADEHVCGSICPLQRNKFNIIWSCLSTVIICSWTSVYPNIPARNEWLARANRLRLMFWMIVAPELVLAWAARQFFAAREIRDKFNQGITGECFCRDIYPVSNLSRLEEMDDDARPLLLHGRIY